MHQKKVQLALDVIKSCTLLQKIDVIGNHWIDIQYIYTVFSFSKRVLWIVKTQFRQKKE